MKIRPLFFALFAILLTACNSSDDSINPELRTYEFFEDSKMIFNMSQGTETLTIEPGAKTVFKYFFRAEENEDIADDGYSENVYFEVDSSLDSFSYSNDDFRDINLVIKRSCFCANVGYVFIGNGSLTGTKLSDGNWSISTSFTFQWEGETDTISRTINGTFVLGSSTDN